MKNMKIGLFLITALSIYILCNSYLYFKGYQVFQEHRFIYTLFFLTLASMFVLAKFLEVRHTSVISDTLNTIGGFWLAFMLYGFLFFLLSDIIIVVLKLTGSIGIESIAICRKWSFIAVAGVLFMLLTAGFINALIPVVKKYDVAINKSAGETKT